MRNGMIAGIAGAVVVAALVLSPLASAFAQQVGPMPMPGVGPHPGGMPMHGMGMHEGMMMGRGPGAWGPVAGQRVDVGQHFIQEMIPHHEDAITMADLALAQAEHPELRELAANIKRVQAEEIEQMRQWYREWYGAEAPAAVPGRHAGPMMPGGAPRGPRHGRPATGG